PCGGRLRERGHPRRDQHDDDRERDPANLPPGSELSARICALVRLDGRADGRAGRVRKGPGDKADRGVRVSQRRSTIGVALEGSAPDGAEGALGGPSAPLRKQSRRSWKSFILPIYTRLMILYLLIPIAIMILYSFNSNPAAGRQTSPQISFRWNGFTL